jgi:hypothetical protein
MIISRSGTRLPGDRVQSGELAMRLGVLPICLTEVEMLTKLDHENNTKLLSVATNGSERCLIFDYAGTDLHKLLHASWHMIRAEC